MAIEIQQEQLGDVQILSLVGRIDADSAADLQLTVEELLAAGSCHLLIDCAGLGYVSSAGLQALTQLASQLQQPRGSLRLCSVPMAVRQMFSEADAGRRFAVYADRAMALADHPNAKLDPSLVSAAARLIGAKESGAPNKLVDPALGAAAARLLGAAQKVKTAKMVTPLPEPATPRVRLPREDASAEPSEDAPGLVDKLKRWLGPKG